MERFAPRETIQFVVLALSLAFAQADGFTAVKGVIRNPQGQPVAGAKIHLTDMAQYWYTESDAHGCFTVSGTTSPTHSLEPLSIMASGYKDASAKVRTTTWNHVVVTLARADSRDESRIQLLTPQNNKDLESCNSSH